MKTLADRLAELAATKKPTQGKLPDVHFGKVGKPLDWRNHKTDDRDDDEPRKPSRSVRALIGFNTFHKPQLRK